MKTALPWLLAIVLGATTFYFYQTSQKRADQISEMEAQAPELEELRRENADLRRVAAQVGELDRLRRDAAEVLRLRGEVSRLRSQAEGLQSQLQQAQTASARTLSQLEQQTEQLREQASTIQDVQNQRAIGICQANLQKIEAVKRQWATQAGSPEGTVPLVQILARFFENNTLPQCPAGGTYTLNAIGIPPTCSVAGHVYPQQ